MADTRAISVLCSLSPQIETDLAIHTCEHGKTKNRKKSGKNKSQSVRTSVAVNMQLCCLFLAIKMPNKEKRPKAKII